MQDFKDIENNQEKSVEKHTGISWSFLGKAGIALGATMLGAFGLTRLLGSNSNKWFSGNIDNYSNENTSQALQLLPSLEDYNMPPQNTYSIISHTLTPEKIDSIPPSQELSDTLKSSHNKKRAWVGGTEFQVNTYESYSQKGPKMAVLTNGNVVIAWNSPRDSDGSQGVYGQLLDSNGNKLGTEFQINTNITNDQILPRISALPNGNFIVAWKSNGQDGSYTGLYGQLFNSNGNKLGAEFQINTYTISEQGWDLCATTIATLKNGSFVVVWHSWAQDGSGLGIYGQRFDSNGNKLGTEFQVNTYIISGQFNPSIAALTNGNFVVTWTSDGQDSNKGGIYGQQFDANGNKIGAEFQVNIYTTDAQDNSVITALAGGRFIVAWDDSLQDGSGFGGIYGQLFDANGNKIGTEFQINTFTIGTQHIPSITTLANGNFLVTWVSNGQDGSGDGIYGQEFNTNGNKIGTEFQVNAYTNGDQTASHDVTGLPDGNFMMIWEGQGASDSYGIYARCFSDIMPPDTTTMSSILSTSNTVSSTTNIPSSNSSLSSNSIPTTTTTLSSTSLYSVPTSTTVSSNSTPTPSTNTLSITQSTIVAPSSISPSNLPTSTKPPSSTSISSSIPPSSDISVSTQSSLTKSISSLTDTSTTIQLSSITSVTVPSNTLTYTQLLETDTSANSDVSQSKSTTSYTENTPSSLQTTNAPSSLTSEINIISSSSISPSNSDSLLLLTDTQLINSDTTGKKMTKTSTSLQSTDIQENDNLSFEAKVGLGVTGAALLVGGAIGFGIYAHNQHKNKKDLCGKSLAEEPSKSTSSISLSSNTPTHQSVSNDENSDNSSSLDDRVVKPLPKLGV